MAIKRKPLDPVEARFFSSITKNFQRKDWGIVAITHLVPDREHFLPALASMAPISKLLAIPYSIDRHVLEHFAGHFPIIEPTLEELRCENYLKNILLSVEAKNVLLCDIGGYFSVVATSRDVHKFRIRGIIEDTENGHRIYESLAKPRIPIFSVARSELKLSEDMNVGNAILFSFERLLREKNRILQPSCCLVLGFGKVGRGIALAIRNRGVRVIVYDTNPIRRIEAFGWGFSIPDRVNCLQQADVIFGATGTQSLELSDFKYLQDGVMLVSASSKDVEFPVHSARKKLSTTYQSTDVEQFKYYNKRILLLRGGLPLNFRDNAVAGPALYLTQAEIISCAQRLMTARFPTKVQELCEGDRLDIAALWVKYFLNPQSGLPATN